MRCQQYEPLYFMNSVDIQYARKYDCVFGGSVYELFATGISMYYIYIYVMEMTWQILFNEFIVCTHKFDHLQCEMRYEIVKPVFRHSGCACVCVFDALFSYTNPTILPLIDMLHAHRARNDMI